MHRAQYQSLVLRSPQVGASELLTELVPPREFENSSFENYIPHPEFPSQATAQESARDFARGKTSRGVFAKAVTAPGIYLDGGFGVGKTHLLSALWHEFRGPKAFGSFISYTSLIGALGFKNAVNALSEFRLICIDEFELDDPGDTMMMSRLLNELAPLGVKFAATSNTPPNALGEGRFAASDFAREIHGISNQFQMLRIDGEDHRHRPVEIQSAELSYEEFENWVETQNPETTSVDDFQELLRHLSTIHPSRFGHLIEGVSSIGLLNLVVLESQVDALRFVALVDRAYEQQVTIRATGLPVTNVFSPDYISGAYRKKYLRAVSRLGAMSS